MRITVLDTAVRRVGEQWHVRVSIEARYEGPAVKGLDRFADLLRAWQHSQHGDWRATPADRSGDVHLRVEVESRMRTPVVFQRGQEIDVTCRDELPPLSAKSGAPPSRESCSERDPDPSAKSGAPPSRESCSERDPDPSLVPGLFFWECNDCMLHGRLPIIRRMNVRQGSAAVEQPPNFRERGLSRPAEGIGR